MTLKQAIFFSEYITVFQVFLKLSVSQEDIQYSSWLSPCEPLLLCFQICKALGRNDNSQKQTCSPVFFGHTDACSWLNQFSSTTKFATCTVDYSCNDRSRSRKGGGEGMAHGPIHRSIPVDPDGYIKVHLYKSRKTTIRASDLVTRPLPWRAPRSGGQDAPILNHGF